MNEVTSTVLYYVLIFGILAAGFAYGYFFDVDYSCNSLECSVSAILKFSWFATTQFLFMCVLGLVVYPATIKTKFDTIDALVEQLKCAVCTRIVTRGTNPVLVRANTRRIVDLLTEHFGERVKWTVEVVTDNPIGLEIDDPAVVETNVPSDYKTEHNTLFKARALNYAVHHGVKLNPADFILHLDEESLIDVRTLQGVLTHVNLNSRPEKLADIAQGSITYAPTEIQDTIHWITTFTDSIRVANDYGAFRIQYQMFNTVFIGMKGSFIVIRNDAECAIGWDHGAPVNITEDAFFSLLAKDMGYRFQFIDACVYELSPFRIGDLWKQRKRWISGLWRVCKSPKLTIGTRIPLIFNMSMWSISWVSLCTIVISVSVPSNAARGLKIAFGMNMALIIITYVMGFFLTRTPREWINEIGVRGYLLALTTQVVGIPLFTFIEGGAVIFWMVQAALDLCRDAPDQFEIVQKEKDEDRKYLQTEFDEPHRSHSHPPC